MVDPEMTNVGLISYGAGTGAGLLLGIYILSRWRERLDNTLLFIAALMTALWSGWAAYQIVVPGTHSWMLYALEVLRDAAWLIFALQLLFALLRRSHKTDMLLRISVALGLYVLALLLSAALLFPQAAVLGATFDYQMALLLAGVFSL